MVNIFFKTYGCQANVADSTFLISYLSNRGRVVSCENEADFIIINSCAIREKAEQKLFSYLGKLALLKEDKPYLRVGVIGCVASYRKRDIFEKFDHVNFVFGAKEDINVLRSYLANALEELETIKKIYYNDPINFPIKFRRDRDIEKIVVERCGGCDFECHSFLQLGQKKLNKLEETGRKKLKRAFVNIMTGCNNYCSYCIVPFTRGREVSYKMKQILEHVKGEVKGGVKEITLVGQNVNSYSDPDSGAKFIALLREVAKIEGNFWVRYISSHPKDMTKNLFEVMAENKDRFCRHLHLPLQSGSDKILKAMNRVYSVEHYLKIVDWIREVLPDATITSDIIVGFPGETEEDYQMTRKIIEKVRFDLIYSFVYSKRKYTTAFNYPDDCKQEEKLSRLYALQERAKEISAENNSKHIGSVQRVLVEDRLKNGRLWGRTSGNVLVHFDGRDEKTGTFVDLKIGKADRVKLEGVLVEKEI